MYLEILEVWQLTELTNLSAGLSFFECLAANKILEFLV